MMTKGPPKFTWRHTRTRGWEGRRVGEKLLKPDMGYREYAVQLLLFEHFHLDPKRWVWAVWRNTEDGHTDTVASGTVNVGDDGVAAARERAQRAAEEAYLRLIWKTGGLGSLFGRR